VREAISRSGEAISRSGSNLSKLLKYFRVWVVFGAILVLKEAFSALKLLSIAAVTGSAATMARAVEASIRRPNLSEVSVPSGAPGTSLTGLVT
jgi:hypothetical protein